MTAAEVRLAHSLLGFLVAVGFWADFIEGATAVRWAVMAVGVPALLIMMHLMQPNRDRAFLPAWTIIPLAGAALTVAWTPDPLTGLEHFIHLAILAGVFVYGAAVDDLGPVWKGVAVGIAVSAALAVAQAAGWEELPQAAVPAGLFVNKNLLGEAALVALIASAMSGWWVLAGFALLAVGLTTSKAVIGALIVVAALWAVGRHPRFATATIAAVALVAILVMAAGAGSAGERLEYWHAAASNATALGHGLGSFATTYPLAEHVHNEPLQAVYELGVLMLPFGVLLFVAMVGGDRPREKLILAGVCGVSLFSFPFHMPVTGFAAALAAGHLVGRWSVVRDSVFESPMGTVGHA